MCIEKMYCWIKSDVVWVKSVQRWGVVWASESRDDSAVSLKIQQGRPDGDEVVSTEGGRGGRRQGVVKMTRSRHEV